MFKTPTLPQQNTDTSYAKHRHHTIQNTDTILSKTLTLPKQNTDLYTIQNTDTLQNKTPTLPDQNNDTINLYTETQNYNNQHFELTKCKGVDYPLTKYLIKALTG